MKIRHLFESTKLNYTMLRAYENNFLKKIDISGAGIDLGAKSSDAKYYPYMNLESVTKLDFVDFYHSGENIIQIDLEKEFPIEEMTYDFVLLFNVLEHIFDYQLVSNEIMRILNKQGVVHGIVPLMWHFHPDPSDYFRYTPHSLEKILTESGFINITIKPIAYGPFKVGVSPFANYIKFWPLRFLIYLFSCIMDRLLSKFSPGMDKYAMAYYFTARKV